MLSAYQGSSCLTPIRSVLYTERLSALSSRRPVPAACSLADDASHRRECRRRDILQYAAATTSLSLLTWPHPLMAAVSGDGSSRTMSIADLRDVVQKDFVQNQYYVTGNLTPQVYTPDCQFKDPTTNVKGMQLYTAAVSKLFDATKSKAEMVSVNISGPNTLTLKWRLAATLNIPGRPAIKPYTGTTKYVTNDSGLICKHLEEWDISALDAFVSVLFPNFGAPPAPPLSQLVSEVRT
ncbi:hypothetical protein ABBQ38_004570 [Trebouxia sp. C0009 RCD-2024]